MYSTILIMELTFLMLAIIFSWIAGSKASKLVYSSGDPVRLQRKTRSLIRGAVYLMLLSLALIGTIGWLMNLYAPLFWMDRLLLHLPLAVLPVVLVCILTLPALRRLRQLAGQADRTQDLMERRRYSSRPELIVPFYMSALGAAAAFYFALTPPVPFRFLEVLIPVLLFICLSAALWMNQESRSQKASENGAVIALSPLWRRLMTSLGLWAVVLVVAGNGIFFGMQASRLPASMNMMVGQADFGGGTVLDHSHVHNHSNHNSHIAATGKVDKLPGTDSNLKTVSVTDLSGPRTGTPDRLFTLVAEKKTVQLSSGKTVDAWTYNGQIPGPELRMKEGELIEVTLVNKDIDRGVTIHWHGLDVPNAEDGVAGATQNAVMPGEQFTYRFLAEQVGSFWYHSHQDSKNAVKKGLFGTLIVEPQQKQFPNEQDITVITHLWDGTIANGASDKLERKSIPPGTPVRMRLINTDDWIRQQYTLVGTKFQVAAIDGTDLHEPGDLENTRLLLTTGGRYDITFIMPETPVYLSIGGHGNLGVLMSPDGQGEIPPLPETTDFDPLHYGKPTAIPFPLDSGFDREFTMVLGDKLGFYNGQFNSLYTINGEVFPNTPMFMVREEELVKTTIINRSSVDHPMHLHGHHMLVLSRNGEAATGSPWWSDTLDVQPGDTYEVAFYTDNPGIWMDHCHNLTHAAIGMTMHLAYEGVTTPFHIGSETNNHPE